jgi:hypothetical protein
MSEDIFDKGLKMDRFANYVELTFTESTILTEFKREKDNDYALIISFGSDRKVIYKGVVKDWPHGPIKTILTKSYKGSQLSVLLCAENLVFSYIHFQINTSENSTPNGTEFHVDANVVHHTTFNEDEDDINEPLYIFFSDTVGEIVAIHGNDTTTKYIFDVSKPNSEEFLVDNINVNDIINTNNKTPTILGVFIHKLDKDKPFYYEKVIMLTRGKVAFNLDSLQVHIADGGIAKDSLFLLMPPVNDSKIAPFTISDKHVIKVYVTDDVNPKVSFYRLVGLPSGNRAFYKELTDIDDEVIHKGDIYPVELGINTLALALTKDGGDVDLGFIIMGVEENKAF